MRGMLVFGLEYSLLFWELQASPQNTTAVKTALNPLPPNAKNNNPLCKTGCAWLSNTVSAIWHGEARIAKTIARTEKTFLYLGGDDCCCCAWLWWCGVSLLLLP